MDRPTRTVPWMIGLTEKILIEIVLLLSRDKAQDRKAWRKLVKQSEEKGGGFNDCRFGFAKYPLVGSPG